MVVQSKGAHLVHYKLKGYLAGLQIYMRKRDYHVIYSVRRYKAQPCLHGAVVPLPLPFIFFKYLLVYYSSCCISLLHFGSEDH